MTKDIGKEKKWIITFSNGYCGCRFVALVPRDNAVDNAMVHQIIKDGNAERWV